jgi:aconitate hydratase
VLHHADGGRDELRARHTLNDDQIRWFRAGSALNLLSAQRP